MNNLQLTFVSVCCAIKLVVITVCMLATLINFDDDSQNTKPNLFSWSPFWINPMIAFVIILSVLVYLEIIFLMK